LEDSIHGEHDHRAAEDGSRMGRAARGSRGTRFAKHEGVSRLRIAQVAPLYESVPPQAYGGTERAVSYLTEELVKLGHEVTLFASGDSRTSARLVPACARSLRLDPRSGRRCCWRRPPTARTPWSPTSPTPTSRPATASSCSATARASPAAFSFAAQLVGDLCYLGRLAGRVRSCPAPSLGRQALPPGQPRRGYAPQGGFTQPMIRVNLLL
jgi:hypothetical protein